MTDAVADPQPTAQSYSPAARRAGLDDPQVAARRRRTAFWGVTEHMLWVYWRYRLTLLTSALGEPVLYLLGMGLGLGALVSHGTGGGRTPTGCPTWCSSPRPCWCRRP
ncbi:hypothetical protein [Rothia kristinae]|uniref:hypothetical protein n=1 Tax=Rothia kristinae TaxID=37923 RepID=UPI002E2A7D99|nr:hypothetical protein [Rothia kristinae]MED6045765.1 hypothetical protein [Rothia kristinae]